jgi:hypothetical protein
MPWWVGGRSPEKKGRTPDLEGVEGSGGGDVDVVGAGWGKEAARERRRKKGMHAGEGEGMRRELCAPTHAGHSSSQNIITPISTLPWKYRSSVGVNKGGISQMCFSLDEPYRL